MRILQIGAGGVGSSAALIAARRDFFDSYLIADYDGARASDLEARVGDKRFTGIGLDASNADAVTEACRQHGITHVLNVVDPRFVMPIFNGAFAAGAGYLDTAMSLSHRHPEKPFELTHVKLGDDQFADFVDQALAAVIERMHRHAERTALNLARIQRQVRTGADKCGGDVGTAADRCQQHVFPDLRINPVERFLGQR